MDKKEIVEKHDYNLNIRRYVDNTPEPEPEDVQAHLIGGVPEPDVEALTIEFGKFGAAPDVIFRPERPGYLAFGDAIDARPAIKSVIEADAALQGTITDHHEVLEAWWSVARDNFAQLENANNGGRKMPEIRHELLSSLKDKLVSLGVLDEFKSAGVFVNWWQQIRFDLKTIVSTGWHHSLIADESLITAFFQAESDEIETLEAKIAEAQSELDEAVETAQEVAGYEPDEDEKVTAAGIKKALKELIDDLKDTPGESGKKEFKALKAQDKTIKVIEKRIKDAKVDLKQKAGERELKLELKRLGSDDFKAEYRLQGSGRSPLTAEQACRLILKKIYDIAFVQMERYLNAEKRQLIAAVENLWDKYAVSSRELEQARAQTLNTLDGFLEGLGYVGGGR